MLPRLAALLCLLAVAAPGAAHAAPPSQRIVNGEPVDASAMPFMAGLEIAIERAGNDDPDALCGGSLIAARWVLTAAHCIAEEPVDVENSYAVLGATDLNTATPDQRYRWAEALYAPAYDQGTGGSDVGLVRLSRPAPFEQLRLLRPADAQVYAPGTTAVTAGWGYTEDPLDGGAISTNQLRKVDLSIVSDADCERSFADAGQPGLLEFATEICAIAPDRDSCNGDSGGPLFVFDQGLPALVGAVSFGIGSGSILRPNRSCNEGPPGVYAKVAADPLNQFVRSHVPQVEIDARPSAPLPGERVTLTAVPRAPGGSGPFGGYDTLAWDLDGDGVHDERAGQDSVQVTAGTDLTVASVQATTTAGDAETRRLRLVSLPKSSISFGSARAKVRAGRSVRVLVVRAGRAAGTVTVKAGRGVTPRKRTLSFSEGFERSRSVRLRASRSAPRSVALRLTTFTGDAIPGSRTRMTLKVRRQR